MDLKAKLRSKRPVPWVLLAVTVAVGFYLSLPVSGLGDKHGIADVTPIENQLSSFGDNRDIGLLKDEMDQERQKAGRYEEELLKEKGYSQFLLQEAQKYKELAGMTTVSGPGIILTLTEIRTSGDEGWSPGAGLIHQEDLLNIINEMWHNSAEAIAIGSPGGRKMERITSFSPIRCSGGAVEINDARLVPPFEIRAIGDGELLKSVLEIRGGTLENLKQFNIDASIEVVDEIQIPNYRGTTHQLYAHSILGEDDAQGSAKEKGGGE